MKFTDPNQSRKERDIEDALYANPGAFPEIGGIYRLEKWVARQYSVPSGIIDLLGLCRSMLGDYALVVVEIKRWKLDAKTIAQVCRYAADIQGILGTIEENYARQVLQYPHVLKVLVGDSTDYNTLLTAEGLKIDMLKCEVGDDIAVVGKWEVPARKSVDAFYKWFELMNDSPFEVFVEDAKRRVYIPGE